MMSTQPRAPGSPSFLAMTSSLQQMDEAMGLIAEAGEMGVPLCDLWAAGLAAALNPLVEASKILIIDLAAFKSHLNKSPHNHGNTEV